MCFVGKLKFKMNQNPITVTWFKIINTNVRCLSKKKKVACSTNVLCRIHVKHILLKELKLKTNKNHITWPLILIWGVFLKERETCMFKGSFCKISHIHAILQKIKIRIIKTLLCDHWNYSSWCEVSF